MIHDISLTLSPSLVSWPGEDCFQLKKMYDMANGDDCNVTKICMSVHQGTHIDSPCHFLENGATSESLSIESMIGQCVVIDVSSLDVSEIGKAHIEGCNLGECRRVIFKTRNSHLWQTGAGRFDKDFVSLSLEAAEYLHKQGVVLIGIDYLSIEGFSSAEHDVHKLLLSNNVIILEGLDLSNIKAGCYELICLPVKIAGSDGSPARAILRDL